MTKATHTTKTLEQEKAAPSNGTADGFSDLSQWDFDGFWSPSPGDTIIGEIVETRAIRDKRTGRPKLIYILLLQTEAVVMSHKKEEKREPGEVIAVSEAAALRRLREVVAVADRPTVRLHAVEKKDLDGGRTMWVFKVGAKGGKRRATPFDVATLLSDAPTVQGAPEPDEQATDEIPF